MQTIPDDFDRKAREMTPDAAMQRRIAAALRAAYEAGAERMRERAARECDAHSADILADTVRALPLEGET